VNLRNEEKIFDSLYGPDVDGHKISHAGRAEMEEEDRKYLIYGELPFSEFVHIFREPAVAEDVEKSEIFYDLGSGMGKILIEAALTLPKLKKIIGIEVVRTLYEASNKIKQKLRFHREAAANKIEVVHGNFLGFDYTRQPPDVVFVHYPMHNAESLYLELEEKLANELKPGALIISGIRRLQNIDKFIPIAVGKVKCSYSEATIYYHRKV
jgi:precorrin-6B methylase 2